MNDLSRWRINSHLDPVIAPNILYVPKYVPLRFAKIFLRGSLYGTTLRGVTAA